MKVFLVVLTFLFLSYTEVSAQPNSSHEFIQATNSKYKYGSSLKKLHEYEDVFLTHPISLDYFKRFNNNRIKAKKLGFLSLGMIVTTPILYNNSIPNGQVDPNGLVLWAGIATSAIAMVSGTTAIILKLNSNSSKAKAIDSFNNNLSQSSLSKHDFNPAIIVRGGSIGVSITL